MAIQFEDRIDSLKYRAMHVRADQTWGHPARWVIQIFGRENLYPPLEIPPEDTPAVRTRIRDFVRAHVRR
jgi:hypothetical protein